jgi:tyrosinase-like protein/Big-like domain-containing protein
VSRRLLLIVTIVTAALFTGSSAARHPPTSVNRLLAPDDLYIKDTPSDTGIEPNPDTGPMWVTEDIWVRNTPDPGYLPTPFPEASPTWTPLGNESPEYRDPKFSVPNYVYVRVRNRGTAASTGNERLRLYFAKASTGLSWPTQWVDYVSGAPAKLFGEEITKPRQNAATATPTQRAAYVQAIVDAASLAPFTFPGGVRYWQKQQQVHRFGPTNRHGGPAFLPWHREFINRYEALLREVNPLVKLLYWDWTTDPENSTGGFNFFTSSFMGASGRSTGGVSIGAPFMPALAPTGSPTGSLTVDRNLSASVVPPASSDASIVGSTGNAYPAFSFAIEEVPNHNSAHGYIGGGGDMSFINSAAQDPFFFLLHANVDRLWAQWQRNVSSLGRLDPATTYGTLSSNANITTSMAPWDGIGTSIRPWTVGDGYIVSKTPLGPSVVSPPIYDTAPLVIPALSPGQAVVLQIPWYPPNPADFASFGPDQGHFCLLARIETAAAAPFGMTFTEGSDVNANTKNNNNIAWKNITVVDNFAGALRLSSALIRNVFRTPVRTAIHFKVPPERGASFLNFGRIIVDLKPELFRQWIAGGGASRGIERVGDTRIRIVSPDAVLDNIQLGPEEVFSMTLNFELNKGQALRVARPKWDIIQTGTPEDPNAVVGGQRFELAVDKLVLIPEGETWRYLDNGSNPGARWRVPGYNDSNWKLGRASLGYGDDPVTTINGGPPLKRRITTYFRRTFTLTDPTVYRTLGLRLRRNDGAVVYLNGKQIHRVNLPSGATPTTPATRDVGGLERQVFFPVAAERSLLHAGPNTIAVEIHVASPRSRDLSFDLELDANRITTGFPPDAVIVSPANGALFQIKKPIPIVVAALDIDGEIASVSFSADGRALGADKSSPFAITWRGAPLGPHRLRAVVTDNSGRRTTVATTVTVLANTPPTATLVKPKDGATFRAGSAIEAVVQASDDGGAVSRVEFFLVNMDRGFNAPVKLVGTARTAPYRVVLRKLAKGEYMLRTRAVDNRGATSPSIPVMFVVE